MNEKLVALALTRAAITEDVETFGLVLAENPPTPALLREVVFLTAGILEHGAGRDRAVAAIDGWLRAVMTGTAR